MVKKNTYQNGDDRGMVYEFVLPTRIRLWPHEATVRTGMEDHLNLVSTLW